MMLKDEDNLIFINVGMGVSQEQVGLPEGHLSGPVCKDYVDGSSGKLPVYCIIVRYHDYTIQPTPTGMALRCTFVSMYITSTVLASMLYTMHVASWHCTEVPISQPLYVCT